MNKILKYTSIIISLILIITVGILTIISTYRANNSLSVSYGYYSKSHHFIYVFIMFSMIIMLASLICFLLYEGINKKINTRFQITTTILILFFLIATILTYMIINLSGDTSLFSMLLSESSDTVSSTIKTNENTLILSLFFGNSIKFLLIFLTITLISQTIILVYSFIDKSEDPSNQIKSSSKNQNKAVTLTPTESIKKEIEEMKQAIELKSLKEEYSKLYKQLNKTTDDD